MLKGLGAGASNFDQSKYGQACRFECEVVSGSVSVASVCVGGCVVCVKCMCNSSQIQRKKNKI